MMRKTFEVEYMIEGVNGYHKMAVQAYHPSEACDMVRAMVQGAHVFGAVLIG